MTTDKKLMYLFETNGDSGFYCDSIKALQLHLEAELEDEDIENPIQITITQEWLTQKQIDNMPEAD